MKALIVSRHESTKDFLRIILENNDILDYEVKEHISDPRELDKFDLVIGNIPLSLFIKSDVKYYIQVNLEIPRELRGKELGIDELRKYVSFVAFYKNVKFESWFPHDKAKAVINTDILLVDNIDSVIDEIKNALSYCEIMREAI